jgi:nicotinate-nucleotide adenylyltransferase
VKIGVFGGSFNPPHAGHLNVVSSVVRKMGLDKVVIIPSFQNPLKLEETTLSASPKQRLAMSQLAFQSLGPQFEVSSIEVDRGGKSYTIQSLEILKKLYPEGSLYLIIGMDNLATFDRWKDWESILTLADLIVTSRPGWEIPVSLEELPSSIRDQVEFFDFSLAQLKSGKTLSFISLKDINTSSTDIRRHIQIGKSVASELTLEVENYIHSEKVYPQLKEKIESYEALVHECVHWMLDRKALNVRAFDLTHLEALGDYALIASGTSTKHASSIAEYIKQEIKKKYNVLPQAIEGLSEGKWVVLDYGIVIIHVFYEYMRQAYALEQIWTGAHEIQTSTMLKTEELKKVSSSSSSGSGVTSSSSSLSNLIARQPSTVSSVSTATSRSRSKSSSKK